MLITKCVDQCHQDTNTHSGDIFIYQIVCEYLKAASDELAVTNS